MTIGEKLQTIANNVQKVYNAGVEAGKAEGGGGGVNPIQRCIDRRKSAHYLFAAFNNSYYYEAADFEGLELNTTGIENMEKMFWNVNWTRIPFTFDTSSLYNASNMFASSKIVESPPIHAPNLFNMSSIFYNCASLETVGEFDMLNVQGLNYARDAFALCKKLKNVNIKNIRVPLTVGSGTTYGHLLTLESLLSLCYECWNNNVVTLTVGSANLEKLASVYVKLIDITDEMRAEDEFVDEKLPFMQCESTDEGAMLITDYMALKRTKIA